MRAITIPQRGFGRGEKCADCRRTLKVGECGLVHRATFGGRHGGSVYLWWHRSCVEKLLAEAPLDATEVAVEFARLREQAERGELLI